MHRWVDHTAELELRLEAASEAAIFEEAVAAVAELLGDELASEVESERISLTAPDRPALLAALVDELAFLAERRGLIAQGASDLELRDGRLEGTLQVRRGRARHLIKGATFHRLALERRAGGWAAVVVLDV